MKQQSNGRRKRPRNCALCGGATKRVQAQVLRTRPIDGSPLVINVPARQCQKCGHKFYSLATMQMIESVQRGEIEPIGSVTVPVYQVRTA